MALIHLVWALAVAITPTGVQQYLNWAVSLHFIALPLVMRQFDVGTAVTLVVVAFVWGFVLGWVLEKIAEIVWKKC